MTKESLPTSAVEQTPPVVSALENAGKALKTLATLVESRPGKCGGVPVLRGTRFSVAQLLAELADGEDVASISDDYDLNSKQLSDVLHAISAYFNAAADSL